MISHVNKLFIAKSTEDEKSNYKTCKCVKERSIMMFVKNSLIIL